MIPSSIGLIAGANNAVAVLAVQTDKFLLSPDCPPPAFSLQHPGHQSHHQKDDDHGMKLENNEEDEGRCNNQESR